MTTVIIKHPIRPVYLSDHYNWQPLPDLFPYWHVAVLLKVMRCPLMVATVDPHSVIDLDAAEWVGVA